MIQRKNRNGTSGTVRYGQSQTNDINAGDTREKIDIVKLKAGIKEIVAREPVLRDEIAKIIAEIEVGI